MRFYPKPPQFYCGSDWHARTMSVCSLKQDGERMGHRNLQARPETLLQAVAPSRDGRVVAGACRFPWYGRAARCAQEGLPFVRGQAL
jgi:hypothetical protein